MPESAFKVRLQFLLRSRRWSDYGDAGAVVADRHAVLTAYAAHPERFVRKPATPPALPVAVWINAPGPAVLTMEARQ